MGATDRRRRRGVLRHYDRPFWRDRMFWVVAVPSVAVTAAIVGVLLLAGGVPDDALGWSRPALVGLLVLMLSFRLLGAGVTTSRHFQRGMGEGTARPDSAMEAKGRAAGRVVGSALRAGRGGAARSATTPDHGTGVAPTAPSEAPPPDAAPVAPAAEAPAPEAPTVEAPAPEATTVEAPTPEATAPDAPAPDGPAAEAPSPPAEPEPGPSAEPTPADEPAPKVTVDAAARVAGAMIGRRLAERRRRRPDQPT